VYGGRDDQPDPLSTAEGPHLPGDSLSPPPLIAHTDLDLAHLPEKIAPGRSLNLPGAVDETEGQTPPFCRYPIRSPAPPTAKPRRRTSAATLLQSLMASALTLTNRAMEIHSLMRGAITVKSFAPPTMAGVMNPKRWWRSNSSVPDVTNVRASATRGHP
jgi:hypothetical protein